MHKRYTGMFFPTRTIQILTKLGEEIFAISKSLKEITLFYFQCDQIFKTIRDK
jgi:hypothetical protein